MTDQDIIDELRREVTRLKAIVKELTEAMKILSDRDERAKAFVHRVESLLSDAEDARDEAVDEMLHNREQKNEQ